MSLGTDYKPIIGILLGDASGSGPEIIAKLAADGRLAKDCRPFIIGDARVFANALEFAKVKAPVTVVKSVAEASWDNSLPLLDMANLDPAAVIMGQPNAECGRAVGETFLKALQMCQDGEIDGILYAPIHKQALYMGGFTYDSEAEMFAKVLNVTSCYGEINILHDLWTTRVTSHVPLKEVSSLLTVQSIGQTIDFGYATLKQAGYASPRLAVTALNPHAGENGKCGREEIDVIRPAVEAAQAKGYDVAGPFPADTIFDRAFNGQFDMVVTLYHDQGQIALKTKGFREGVTVSGGLPIPLVTPAHGTAFGKAGKGTVDVGATINALAVCVRMSRQHKKQRDAKSS